MIRDKRGQVTLFIIIAIVVVALVVLAFIFVPRIMPRERIPTAVLDPEAYVADCINLALEPMVETITSQGGYFEPGNYILYQNTKISYLCYTSTNYEPCINQEPLLKEHIEELLEDELREQATVANCINSFAGAAIKKSWDVSVCDTPIFSVNLTEGKVSVPIKCAVTMTKGEDTRRFEDFSPFLKWPLFEFVILAKEIIDDEITYTSFDYISYMLTHSWIEIEKYVTSDKSEIYTLRERATRNEFVFAIKNYVLPPGLI